MSSSEVAVPSDESADSFESNAMQFVVVGTNDRAKNLAERLGRPNEPTEPAPTRGVGAIIVPDEGPLSLVGFVEGGPVEIDLASAAKRRGGKRSDLARAIGVGKGMRTVIDATAGLGRDAAALCAAGCMVTAVERSPVLAALWEDALPCAALPALTFIHADAAAVLERAAKLTEAQRPDAVYLDPMFPPRTKSALVGKDLRTLSQVLNAEDLVGAPEEDGRRLLALSQKAAMRRVVVKRPKRAPLLAEGVAHQFVGTTVRFDLYLV